MKLRNDSRSPAAGGFRRSPQRLCPQHLGFRRGMLGSNLIGVEENHGKSSSIGYVIGFNVLAIPGCVNNHKKKKN
jgi:hypothetical protein